MSDIVENMMDEVIKRLLEIKFDMSEMKDEDKKLKEIVRERLIDEGYENNQVLSLPSGEVYIQRSQSLSKELMETQFPELFKKFYKVKIIPETKEYTISKKNKLTIQAEYPEAWAKCSAENTAKVFTK